MQRSQYIEVPQITSSDGKKLLFKGAPVFVVAVVAIIVVIIGTHFVQVFLIKLSLLFQNHGFFLKKLAQHGNFKCPFEPT